VAAEFEVPFRLIRADDQPPTNPLGDAFRFGLQDTEGALAPAARLPDGRLYWDFTLRVKEGGAEPNFLGRFASGPAGDRFIYLAWLSIPRGVWINRVKARLSDLDWPLVRDAAATGRPLTADLTGRSPGGGRVPVDWRLGDA
jgi:uncharacterized protein DUF5990